MVHREILDKRGRYKSKDQLNKGNRGGRRGIEEVGT